MDVAAFDYDLPPARIAQRAAEPRDAARLLRVPRAGGAFQHSLIRELPELLAPGDLLVVNDTRVIAARLRGRKPTGGEVRLVLLEPVAHGWRALLGASHAPRPGTTIELPAGFRATLLTAVGPGGEVLVEIDGPGSVDSLLAQAGALPLPPYIRRRHDDPEHQIDRERYQTIFARTAGALAAPTAGLHFTPELLSRLDAAGIGWASVTLHVGEGTFRPVTVANTAAIRLHPERFRLPPETAAAIAACRARGGRVIAVGTTVVRVLESRPAGENGGPLPGEGETSLFISPGWSFSFVDGLLTNFHLPRSTLLMLVCAFAGHAPVLDAYRVAIAAGYRFYSYGDAMLCL